MKGNILNYDIQSSEGIISAEDGNRYTFTNSEWKDDKSPNSNQTVDFEVDDKKAKDIYVIASDKVSINTDEIKEKFDDFKNSDNVQNAQAKVQTILNNGVQNKFGFIVSIVMAFTLFLPVIVIPFLGNICLLDGGWGKVTFLGLIVIAMLFYAGMKKQFVEIAIGIVSFLLLIQFYNLISSLVQGSNINLLKLLRIGTYVLVPMTFVLLFAGFKSKYVEKENKSV